MKGLLATVLLLLSMSITSAQNTIRVEPPSWWVGMENPDLQLMVYGEDIGNAIKVEVEYSGC